MNNDNCYKTNINNPAGNFLPFDDRTRGFACNTLTSNNPTVSSDNSDKSEWYKSSLTENNIQTQQPTQTTGFNNIQTQQPTLIETAGFNNIYRMPVTTSAPDTIGFANFLFPNPGRCRETGYMCVSNVDSTTSIDRLAYYSNDTYYQTINNKK
jgi:hypothetical protein